MLIRKNAKVEQKYKNVNQCVLSYSDLITYLVGRYRFFYYCGETKA